MSIQIDITKNGTTTLATAGKYCDRNVDVNVNVPTYESELAQKTADVDNMIIRNSEPWTLVNTTAPYVASRALMSTPGLTRADFSNVTMISTYALNSCDTLTALILRKNVVVNLKDTNAIGFTPIESGTGFVYVPDNLVSSYKSATNWVAYANQIKPISELGE